MFRGFLKSEAQQAEPTLPTITLENGEELLLAIDNDHKADRQKLLEQYYNLLIEKTEKQLIESMNMSRDELNKLTFNKDETSPIMAAKALMLLLDAMKKAINGQVDISNIKDNLTYINHIKKEPELLRDNPSITSFLSLMKITMAFSDDLVDIFKEKCNWFIKSIAMTTIATAKMTTKNDDVIRDQLNEIYIGLACAFSSNTETSKMTNSTAVEDDFQLVAKVESKDEQKQLHDELTSETSGTSQEEKVKDDTTNEKELVSPDLTEKKGTDTTTENSTTSSTPTEEDEFFDTPEYENGHNDSPVSDAPSAPMIATDDQIDHTRTLEHRFMVTVTHIYELTTDLDTAIKEGTTNSKELKEIFENFNEEKKVFATKKDELTKRLQECELMSPKSEELKNQLEMIEDLLNLIKTYCQKYQTAIEGASRQQQDSEIIESVTVAAHSTGMVTIEDKTSNSAPSVIEEQAAPKAQLSSGKENESKPAIKAEEIAHPIQPEQPVRPVDAMSQPKNVERHPGFWQQHGSKIIAGLTFAAISAGVVTAAVIFWPFLVTLSVMTLVSLAITAAYTTFTLSAVAGITSDKLINTNPQPSERIQDHSPAANRTCTSMRLTTAMGGNTISAPKDNNEKTTDIKHNDVPSILDHQATTSPRPKQR